MASIEIERLLTEIAPDAPCGPDLEYDSAFSALEQAARGKPEQQLGDNITPAEAPDWLDVRSRAEELLARSKDIRVAVLYLRALTRIESLDGLSAGLNLICEILNRFWDQLHPLPDPDDNDPIMRMNALAALNDPAALLGDVRAAYLMPPSALGSVAVRDLLMVTGKLPAVEPVPTQAEVEGMIRMAGEQNVVPLRAIADSRKSLGALKLLLGEKVGSETAPDLDALEETLVAIAHACSEILPEAAVDEDDDKAASLPGDAPAKPVSGDIRSREDARRILDRVCEFIERTEPTSPAPLFIRRAQQLMGKSFVEVIEDLVPDSLGQIQKMAGLDRQ